ncbi:hypothetical protein C8Q72DRAFT_575051 [Fomitopsis betulina]|nr:hypothetical protein C8Q72DRAFT_575051 [Fomitopsis betulina]
MTITLSSPTLLPCDTQKIQIHHPYVITYTDDSVDIWHLPLPDGHMLHVVRLQHPVPYPGRKDPSNTESLNTIVDADRQLIIIPIERSHDFPTSLWIFNLRDGELLRKIELLGTLPDTPLTYRDGKVLVMVADEESDESRLRMSVLICDVQSGSLEGGIRIPEHLAERERKRVAETCIIWPAFISPEFDIIATSSEAWMSTMEVLRYPTSRDKGFPQPDASFQLTESIADGDEISPMCSTGLDAGAFVLAVYEGTGGLPQGNQCQTACYAIDSRSMAVLWSAPTVWGQIDRIWYVPSLDAIVAIGKHDTGEKWGGDGSPWATTLVILDPSTGAQRRFETIHYGVQGSPVKHCAVTPGEHDPTLVVVFEDGEICAVSVESFIKTGLPKEGHRLQTQRSFDGSCTVNWALVVERTVLVSVSLMDGVTSVSCINW